MPIYSPAPLEDQELVLSIHRGLASLQIAGRTIEALPQSQAIELLRAIVEALNNRYKEGFVAGMRNSHRA